MPGPAALKARVVVLIAALVLAACTPAPAPPPTATTSAPPARLAGEGFDARRSSSTRTFIRDAGRPAQQLPPGGDNGGTGVSR